MLEVIVTLVVLGVIAGLGVVSFRSVSDRADTRSVGLKLATAQVAARQEASGNNNRYPAEVATTIKASSLSFVAGASTGPDVVSILRVDDTTLVMAMRDEDGCVALVDSTIAPARWAWDLESFACSAGGASTKDRSAWSTDQAAPTSVDLD